MSLEPPGFGEACRHNAIGTDAATGEKRRVTCDEQGHVEAGGHKFVAFPLRGDGSDASPESLRQRDSLYPYSAVRRPREKRD
jgi:hypothetical protein